MQELKTIAKKIQITFVVVPATTTKIRKNPNNAFASIVWVIGSEGAGARTLDLRIKSPLLYRLSYALI